MGNMLDLAGQRFGELTVIGRSGKRSGKNVCWWCQCSCGNLSCVAGKNLQTGNTKTCGCSRGEAKERDPLYDVWAGMVRRCSSINLMRYTRTSYMQNGIVVCRKWRNSFEVFAQWARSEGYKPGMQMHRIDSNGPYSPFNCKFLDQHTHMSLHGQKGVKVRERKKNIGW